MRWPSTKQSKQIGLSKNIATRGHDQFLLGTFRWSVPLLETLNISSQTNGQNKTIKVTI